MLPLLAIGTAIGAASSIVNAVSWVSRQLADARPADTDSPTAAKKDFAAALSAKTAGQKLPPVVASPVPQATNWQASLSPQATNWQASLSPQATNWQASLSPQATNWQASLSATAASPGPTDIQARIQASLSAYRQHGEHRQPGTG